MRFWRTTGVALAALGLTAPLFAAETSSIAPEVVQAQLVEDIGASERVEAATLLRVLSQESAAAACHLSHGVAIDTSQKLLLEAKTKFNLILDALENGNESMNIIGKEERKKTLMKIEKTRSLWTPVYDAAVTLLEDPQNQAAIDVILAGNEAVLDATFTLTSEIAGEYSNPAELLQADVMLMDFSGRQALMTQKLVKLACEIWGGNRSEDRIELLKSAMQAFEMTKVALHEGMPSVGILAAPTDEIEAALAASRAEWEGIKSDLTYVMENEEVSDEHKERLFEELTEAMYKMERIEHLYVIYSKHKYN